MSKTGQTVYDILMSTLSGAFENSKGIGADCPFCGAESSSGKIRFLVFADPGDGNVSGYNCYVCNKRGDKLALRRLYQTLGLNIFKMEVLNGGSTSGFKYKPQNEKDEETGFFGNKKKISKANEEIQWPPHWATADEEHFSKAVSFMEKRGVQNPASQIEKYNLVITLEIDRGSGADGHSFLEFYPSVVCPAVDIDGNIVGWSARRIDGLDELAVKHGVKKDEDHIYYSQAKSVGMGGSSWKQSALFGISEVNPNYPVTIVEGFYDALATPNSVALLGKRLTPQHAKIVADLQAEYILLGLDPTVSSKELAGAISLLQLSAPKSKILKLNYGEKKDEALDPEAKDWNERDPGDRGQKEMSLLIRQTVTAALKAKA